MNATTLTPTTPRLSRWRQYVALTKPRVVQLIVFCAAIGMLLAVPGLPRWADLVTAVIASVGIWLVASAAAAFNCLIEQKIDSRMKRTSWRPTANGDLRQSQALLFSAVLCAAGMALLYFRVNPLTAWLTFGTFVGYAVIYTVVLKPMTPQNIVIGGASGAMPPVLGWAALTGEVGPEAIALFLIIFLWTPPHFWALALYRAEDYARAGLPMLPVSHGVPLTCLHILLYTVLLAAVSYLPATLGLSGGIYVALVSLLNLGYLREAWVLWRHYSDARARHAFRYSLIYLTGLFVALFLDRLA